MSAQVIEFKRPEGPQSELDSIAADVRKTYADAFQRRMPGELAAMIAEAIASAPPKVR